MDLHDYLRVLRQQWLLVALSAALAVAVAAVVTLQATPIYESTARLFVTSPTSDATATGAYQGSLFTQQRVTSYADLVTTERVAAAVVEAEGLDESPSALAQRVSARVIPETVLLDVTVADESPAQAQRLARAVARESIELITELEKPPGGARPIVKVSVVEDPARPDSPVSPQPLRNLGLALVLGLLVGIGLAVLREVLSTSLDSAEEVKEVSGGPGLGVIGYDKEAAAKPLVVQLEPRSRRAEAFRQLRTNLQYVDVDRPTKVITITSSVPGEGKTTTAINLALTLAEAGQRVVLVEGDLRRPKVADYLGLVGQVGLTNVLIGRLDLADAVQPYGEQQLLVLASGPIPPNAAELLQSHAMHQVLKDLEEIADVILIDAPPLLPVTDAAILAAQSDGAVIVVRYGETRREQLKTAVESLAAVDARIMGTVLNMAPSKGPDAYTYGYGYSYEPKPGRRRARVIARD